MLAKARPKVALAFCGAFGSFTNINQSAPVVERVNSTLTRPTTLLKPEVRTGFKVFDNLISYAKIKVEFEGMWIIIWRSHPKLVAQNCRSVTRDAMQACSLGYFR